MQMFHVAAEFSEQVNCKKSDGITFSLLHIFKFLYTLRVQTLHTDDSCNTIIIGIISLLKNIPLYDNQHHKTMYQPHRTNEQ